MKKTMKKITCSVLAAVSVFGCAATMSACESDHPKVEMTLEFNGESYVLDYQLYRKIAPATVNHFLWLAGNGYYDGLCVHDYEESKRLYTGVYSASEEDPTQLVYKKYYETIAGYENYEQFPHSVWLDSEKANPTYTLKGEFEDNDFKVTNGALEESFGSLSMFYETINRKGISERDVYFARAGEEGGVSKRDYQYNHTTSAFFISLTTTNQANVNYCTFATLDEDSLETLNEFTTALSDYVEKHYADDDDAFTQEFEDENVFEDDARFENAEQAGTYDVPKAAIVIKQVKVKKY